MNSGKIHQSLLEISAAYRAKLIGMDEEQFIKTPPSGGWSYSEVYSHIFDSSLLSLMALANCNKGDGEKRPTTFGAKLILFFGSLPPGKKYKVPTRLASRVNKINLMAAGQLITDFDLQLAKISPEVKNANPNIKVKHPRLGYLNAEAWLRFIEVHLNHHLKQLKRIERDLK